MPPMDIINFKPDTAQPNISTRQHSTSKKQDTEKHMAPETITRRHEAHVLVISYPAQGHITPMIQFSKRLASRGVKVTLVNTKSISGSVHADPNGPIAVETISDGHDEGGILAAESIEAYLNTFQNVGSQGLSDLVIKFEGSNHPVTAIIYDGFVPWALDVAKKFGKLGVLFFTQSCAVNSVYYHVQRGVLPMRISGESGGVSLPAMPELDVAELPSFVTKDGYGSYPSIWDLLMNQFVKIDDADWLLFNIFYELEPEIVDWMSKRWRVGTIGPTLPSMYLDKTLEDDKGYGMHLFKPNTSACISWLQDKPSGSVVYVSFGSMADLGKEQMGELAWGLKESKCYFLWVVRASEEEKLPSNFVNETSDKGLVVNWCPQLDVLMHESVGCFVTHCGFNSVLEAMSLGVPMVAMPQWTDQPTNAKYVEDVWKVGIRAKVDETGIVRRETIETCIKEVIEGEKGKEMKRNAKTWGDLAKKALDVGGSSDKCTNEFVASLVGHK